MKTVSPLVLACEDTVEICRQDSNTPKVKEDDVHHGKTPTIDSRISPVWSSVCLWESPMTHRNDTRSPDQSLTREIPSRKGA